MLRAVCFGDSITRGVFVREDERYIALLEQAFPSIEFLNRGVPGNTIAAGRSRFEAEVLQSDPDICIIFFGMNDTVCDAGIDVPKVSEEQFRKDLEYFIDELHRRHCRVIVCTIYDVIEGGDESYYYHRHPRSHYQNPPGVRAWLQRYSVIVKEAAREKKAAVADLRQSFQTYVENGGKLERLLVSKEHWASMTAFTRIRQAIG